MNASCCGDLEWISFRATGSFDDTRVAWKTLANEPSPSSECAVTDGNVGRPMLTAGS